uniref:Uncharacterized protein n=1 Tax=Arundo donax TaxID=35708 RepID=A0A0A8Y876_ARUDO
MDVRRRRSSGHQAAGDRSSSRRTITAKSKTLLANLVLKLVDLRKGKGFLLLVTTGVAAGGREGEGPRRSR